MTPSQIPRPNAGDGSSAVRANAITQRKRADRAASGTACIASSNFLMFARSPAPSPAYRADRTPGAPPSASTSRPESSAIAGRPLNAAACRAFKSALSSKVSPVSSGGSIPNSDCGTNSKPNGPSMSENSRIFPALPVASTIRMVQGLPAWRDSRCRSCSREIPLDAKPSMTSSSSRRNA